MRWPITWKALKELIYIDTGQLIIPRGLSICNKHQVVSFILPLQICPDLQPYPSVYHEGLHVLSFELLIILDALQKKSLFKLYSPVMPAGFHPSLPLSCLLPTRGVKVIWHRPLSGKVCCTPFPRTTNDISNFTKHGSRRGLSGGFRKLDPKFCFWDVLGQNFWPYLP